MPQNILRSKKHHSQKKVAVLGAGPAGLSAAYWLAREGISVTVLEKTSHTGGLSRTESRDGFLFDIGGHRFFTKFPEIQNLWNEILTDEFLTVKRLSRIFYRKKYYYYPLQAFDILKKLGVIETGLCLFSYVYSWIKGLFKVFIKKTKQISFEDWISNRFGKRLYKIFFKTYSEKVWGIPCSQISSDWAAQRIKGLDFLLLIKNSFGIKNNVTTLINSFMYPAKGPGMLWERCAEIITGMNGKIYHNRNIKKINYNKESETWEIIQNYNNKESAVKVTDVISSIPLCELPFLLYPPPSKEFQKKAKMLRYRDFILVALIIKGKNPFPDQWIYLHDPLVQASRIQNFTNWSDEMVPDKNSVCLGLEYFCFENDVLWNKSDKEIIEVARHDIQTTGLVDFKDILKGYVIRQKKAYPLYDNHYQDAVNTIRRELESKYPGFHPVGRNGMHKYDSQDHAMLTAIYAAKNIINGKADFDPWRISLGGENYQPPER